MLKHDELAGGALASLKEQGIAVPDKAEYYIPRLPVVVTVLGDADLMELYSKLTAYADFVSVQVSCAIIDERQSEKRLQGKVDQMMLLYAGGGKGEQRVTYARAQIAADDVVVGLKSTADTTYAYRKLIESMAGNIERDTFLVSRELTRRTSGIATRRTGWTP